MKIHIREIHEQEKRFAYAQSQQLDFRTGCIGVLHGNLRFSEIELYKEQNKCLRIQDSVQFRNIFDQAMQTLMTEERFIFILEDKLTLQDLNQTDAIIHLDQSMIYGLRIDAEKYTFLLRISADKTQYNVHCYNYYRGSLDRHIHNAGRGIYFVDPNYNEQFRLDDGDYIRILLPNHYYVDKQCRYVDEYHVEVEGQIYHIIEFADEMEYLSNKVIPYRCTLPDECYTLHSETGELLRIRKGEDYYFHAGLLGNWSTVAYRNKMIGVSSLEAQIMNAGVVHGWASREADPRYYTPEGIFIPEPQKEKRR